MTFTFFLLKLIVRRFDYVVDAAKFYSFMIHLLDIIYVSDTVNPLENI